MTRQSKIKKWIRPQVQALSAYHVPDTSDCIKLDAMENPYGWPQTLVDEWLGRLRGVELNRYPDPDGKELVKTLRTAMEIPESLGLLLGNGSDELIQMIILSVAGQGRVVLAPEPTFVMYRIIAEIAGMKYVGVPLQKDDFELDSVAMLAAINEHDPAVVFLAYPNNPSANLFDEAGVHAIIDAANGLVVVDEAYAAFASASFLGKLSGLDNVLVLRTVSKMGLAGLRLGYLAGAPDWLHEINKTRLPYNINVLTQVSADFALVHKAILDEQAQKICDDRTLVSAALSEMEGIHIYPSEANFILFRTPKGQATNLFEALQQKGVLIKNMHPAGGLLQDCLRVTIGTPEENKAFLSALQSSLA